MCSLLHTGSILLLRDPRVGSVWVVSSRSVTPGWPAAREIQNLQGAGGGGRRGGGLTTNRLSFMSGYGVRNSPYALMLSGVGCARSEGHTGKEKVGV